MRRPHAVIATFEGADCVIRNFLQRRAFACSLAWMQVLAQLSEWTDAATAQEFVEHAGVGPDPARQVEAMVRLGGLLAEGSAEAETDELYARCWEWGPMAGHFHFGIRVAEEADYETAETLDAFLAFRSMTRDAPELIQRNTPGSFRLPRAQLERAELHLMATRQSRRAFLARPLELQDLANILFAGFGVLTTRQVPGHGGLPRKMAPSGGARNPFEGYVLVRRVHGIEPGVYHYDAVDQSLEAVPGDDLPRSRSLLAGQESADAAAAVIFLVADFERSMWKYPNPHAYGAVLREAGHIAQNLLLAMTAAGAAGFPTPALTDELCDRVLGLDGIRRSALYAVVMGIPDLDADPGFVALPTVS